MENLIKENRQTSLIEEDKAASDNSGYSHCGEEDCCSNDHHRLSMENIDKKKTIFPQARR